MYVILSGKCKKFNLTKQSNSNKINKNIQNEKNKKQTKETRTNTQGGCMIILCTLVCICGELTNTACKLLELLVKRICSRHMKNGIHRQSLVCDSLCYKSPKLKATQMLDIEVIIWRYSYSGMLSQNVEGRNMTTAPELRNHSRWRLIMPSPADGEKTRTWWMVSEQDWRRTFLSDGSDLYLD